jgi:hypothetical protein
LAATENGNRDGGEAAWRQQNIVMAEMMKQAESSYRKKTKSEGKTARRKLASAALAKAYA